MQPVDFIEDTSTDFLNPERGWIGAGSSYAQARSSGLSVIWTNAWEGSLYRLDDYRDSALPSTPMVGFGYFAHVRELFGNTPMDLEERFIGTNRSRAGWPNDCFFADRTNIGTFDYWASEEAGDFGRATFESIGNYAAASAETCSVAGLTEYSTCCASLTEMETMSGPDLLNRDYWTGIYDRWMQDGCCDERSRCQA